MGAEPLVEADPVRIRHPMVLLALPVVVACSDATFEDRCADAFTRGRLHVRLLPEPGILGAGTLLWVGDTLRLTALLQAEVGAHTDVFGSGGCALEFSEPLPATIVWRSSNTSILTVDQQGLITGRAVGTASAIARATSQGVESSREMTVHLGYPFGER